MENYDRALALWRDDLPKSEAELDAKLDHFRVLFAYHSGKMENDAITYHDTREIFENSRVAGFSGDPRALFEQQNQKMCFELLKPKIVAKEPVTIELILDMHLALTSGTYDERRFIANGERPGAFKRHDYVTGIHEVGSPAALVRGHLEELLAEVNEYSGNQILKTGAYLHVRFEDIHPFADGNGRVGRSLLNYYLMVHGHPPLILYDEDKSLYYECLLRYDESEDIESLHQFFVFETARTWKKMVELRTGDGGARKNLLEQI